MNSTNFSNEQLLGPNGAKMMHSTSVNAINTMAQGALVAGEHNRAGLNAPTSTNLYNRQFHQHGGNAHHHPSHSQSTANLTQPSKLNFTNNSNTSGNRQSATNGIKLMPSQQLGSRVATGQRSESPATQTVGTQGHSQMISLSHHQNATAAQQAKRQHQSHTLHSGKVGAINTTSNSGRHSSVVLGNSSSQNTRIKAQSGSFSSGAATTTQANIAMAKDKQLLREQLPQKTPTTASSLKHAKSIETMPMSGGGGPSQKPPSSSSIKPQTSQQLTRATIDTTASSATQQHQQHKSQSHTRTQATLGLKQHQLLGNNNSRTHLKATDGSLKVISSSQIGHKRSSGDTGADIEKKSSFGKHTSSNNRLVAPKTTSSISDFKKPVSLSSHPISLSKGHIQHTGQTNSYQPASATSQIVSQHTYQPAISNQTQQMHTISMTHHKSGAQLHTPTTTSLKGNKPPLDSNKSQVHTGGLQPSNTVAVPSASYQQKRHSFGRGSPRSQLHVFTKKSSHDAGSSKHTPSGGMTISDPKSNFNHTSTNLKTASAFSPQEEKTTSSAKRRSGDVGSRAIFPHSSKSSTAQLGQRSTVSMKNQLSHQHGRSGDKKHHSSSHQQHHHPHSSSTKSRNISTKVSVTCSGNHLAAREPQNKISAAAALPRHQSQSNPSLDLANAHASNDGQVGDAEQYASRSSHKKSSQQQQQQQQQQQHFPLTTKHSVSSAVVGTGGLGARSSSVSMKQAATSGGAEHNSQHEESSASGIGQQATAKINGGVPTILNSYKMRSASPPEPNGAAKVNTKPNSQIVESQSNNASTRQQQQQQPPGSFISQMSYKMAQNRVPQIASSSSSAAATSKMNTIQGAKESHQHPTRSQVANQIAQRKVRSATRPSEHEPPRSSAIGSKTSHQHGATGENGAAGSGAGGMINGGHTGNAFLQQKLSQQKFTDRPSSASAGQKFIGRQQNLKELFERNWQSVNVQNKVDPNSGETNQIRSLTVVDTNSMVHEEQQEATVLPLAPGTRIIIPNHEPTKCSNKRNGIVRAYAANTNQGLVRNYNEDRVSIILNIVKPEHRKHETWPTCSFFGVYDGHGGSACAEFLRDNLHHFVIKEESFPWQPEDAIRRGFEKAETRFLEMCQAKDEVTGKMNVIERSGSCAIVVLIIGEICYVANVGDSRAVLSSGGGQQMTALSRDHKPSDIDEYKRIIKAGGQIYQTTTSQVLSKEQIAAQQPQERMPADPEFIVGPIRVLPGRLSVCRTFGDPEAKLAYRNGNPNVVTALPDIKTFQISKQHDFIALASDGIFDKLNDDDIGKAVWLTCEAAKQAKSTATASSSPQVKQQQQQLANSISVHQFCGLGVEGILKNSLMRQSLDNVTVVMVAFQNFKRVVCGQNSSRSTIDRTVTQTNSANRPKDRAAAEHGANITSAEQKQLGHEENLNLLNNKKISGVRSHQALATRSANSNHNGAPDRQLTRQSGNDHGLARQSKHDNDMVQGNNLPRTRSLNQDQIAGGHHYGGGGQESSSDIGFSIRQQQQANKLAQPGGQQSQGKQRASIEQIQPRSSAQQSQQPAKPPMSSVSTAGGGSGVSGGVQQTKSTKIQYQQRDQAQISSGMRSLSLKEVKPASSTTANSHGQMSTNNAFHGRMNHLANLNSNKSLGVVAQQHGIFNHTPTTQAQSVKSGSSPAGMAMQQYPQQQVLASQATQQPQQYRLKTMHPQV